MDTPRGSIRSIISAGWAARRQRSTQERRGSVQRAEFAIGCGGRQQERRGANELAATAGDGAGEHGEERGACARITLRSRKAPPLDAKMIADDRKFGKGRLVIREVDATERGFDVER